jgi:hypothetical protein
MRGRDFFCSWLSPEVIETFLWRREEELMLIYAEKSSAPASL